MPSDSLLGKTHTPNIAREMPKCTDPIPWISLFAYEARSRDEDERRRERALSREAAAIGRCFLAELGLAP